MKTTDKPSVYRGQLISSLSKKELEQALVSAITEIYRLREFHLETLKSMSSLVQLQTGVEVPSDIVQNLDKFTEGEE